MAVTALITGPGDGLFRGMSFLLWSPCSLPSTQRWRKLRHSKTEVPRLVHGGPAAPRLTLDFPDLALFIPLCCLNKQASPPARFCRDHGARKYEKARSPALSLPASTPACPVGVESQA